MCEKKVETTECVWDVGKKRETTECVWEKGGREQKV